jgi:hypothetical protein
MHVNTQVRNAAKVRLDATSLETVLTQRGSNLLELELPAAVISTTSWESGNATKGLDETERRQIELGVVLVLNADVQDLDDQADALTVEVEAALADDLGGLAKRMEHQGGDLELMEDEAGDRWVAFLALRWMVEIWTVRGDPEVAL